MNMSFNLPICAFFFTYGYIPASVKTVYNFSVLLSQITLCKKWHLIISAAAWKWWAWRTAAGIPPRRWARATTWIPPVRRTPTVVIIYFSHIVYIHIFVTTIGHTVCGRRCVIATTATCHWTTSSFH